MTGQMARRALTALTILLSAAAALLFGFALAGTGDRAGAAPKAPSTTCGFLSCGTTPPPSTTVPVTSPPTSPRTSPPTTRPAVQQTRLPGITTPRTTTPSSTTTTTLPGLGNLPVTPSTVPFTTKQQSSHVSPVFAALSGIGFFLALVIVAVRFWITRPDH